MVTAAWPSLSFVGMLIKPFNLTVLPLSLLFQPFCYFPSSPRPFHVFIFSCVHIFLLFEGFSWLCPPLFCLCIPCLHSTSGLFWWLFCLAFLLWIDLSFPLIPWCCGFFVCLFSPTPSLIFACLNSRLCERLPHLISTCTPFNPVYIQSLYFVRFCNILFHCFQCP